MQIPPSELILNPDGSIYHLNLRPEQVAQTIILVGDPDRVLRVSRHFDAVEHRVQKREFVTHTGRVGSQRLSVVSTGIGTDNIDIVLNELDALVNIDLENRRVKPELTTLDFVRIGTSGSMSRDVGVDEFLISEMAIGLESLLHFYPHQLSEREENLQHRFLEFAEKQGVKLNCYTAGANLELVEILAAGQKRGITLTSPGFYGPQGRTLRLGSILGKAFFDQCAAFSFEGLHLTNFEMESSGIFALARLLGHRAVSCNAIIANRVKNEFSQQPKVTVNRLIEWVLERLGQAKK